MIYNPPEALENIVDIDAGIQAVVYADSMDAAHPFRVAFRDIDADATISVVFCLTREQAHNKGLAFVEGRPE